MEIRGTYGKTRYRNYMTGETEFLLLPDIKISGLTDGFLTCRGVIGLYDEGTPLAVTGEMDKNILNVTHCIIPSTGRDGVLCVLRHVAKEMTDLQMERIVDEAKDDMFKFFLSDYGKVFIAGVLRKDVNDSYVRGITGKIKKLALMEELVTALTSYGIPLDITEALYENGITPDKINKNPYMILLKYNADIGTVDRYAAEHGIKEYDMRRLCGFTLDALRCIKSGGNTCAKINEVVYVINRRFERYGYYKTAVNAAVVNTCIGELKDTEYHREGDSVYIYDVKTLKEEDAVVKHVKRLNSNRREYVPEKTVSEIERELNITYNREQREAFKAIETSGIKIITGPPGSGKTMVIRGLIKAFGKNGEVKLAATTGMAARVMKDACRHEAQTVNILLNVIPYDSTVKSRDLNDPVNAGLIIVDEISMIDLSMFSVLVQAVKSGAVLILVGDENQLPSVGYGNVLHDMIKSGCAEVYRLKEVMRFSGTLCINADLINKGSAALVTDESFKITHVETEKELFDTVKAIDVTKSQILCPLRRNGISTKNINKIFVKKTNPFITAYGTKRFFLHDRVIMTKTDYKKGYVNGDMGYVAGARKGNMIIQFPDRVLTLDRDDLKYVDYAYAITVHKSQGSEFGEIYIILPPDAECMMTRRLLYTAVTRAKQKVNILEMNGAVRKAVQNAKETGRRTLLAERLEKLCLKSGQA